MQPVVEHILQNKVGYVAPFLLVGAGMGFMEYQISGLDDEVGKLNRRGLIEYVITLDDRLCMNPTDAGLRRQIAEAIAEYEQASSSGFPIPLRCASAD